MTTENQATMNISITDPHAVINSLQTRIVDLERQLADAYAITKDNIDGEVRGALRHLRMMCVIPLYVGKSCDFENIKASIQRSRIDTWSARTAFSEVWNIHDAPLTESEKQAVMDASQSGSRRW